MYKLIKRIEGVLHEFLYFECNLVVAKIEGGIEKFFFNTTEINQGWKLEAEPLHRLALIDDNIIASNANGNAFIFSKQGVEEKRLNDIVVEIPNLGDGSSLIFNRLNKLTEKENIISNKVFWSEKCRIGKNKLLTNGFLFFTYYLKDWELFCTSMSTGKIISSINIRDNLTKKNIENAENMRVQKIVGENQGLLYCVLENNKMCCWSSIDNNFNYDVISNLNTSNNALKEHAQCNLEQSIFINESNEKMIGISHTDYWEIDFDNKQMLFVDLSSQFNENFVSVSAGGKVTFKDGHIFFCSNFITTTPDGTDFICKIGAFNIALQKITWTHQFDFERGVRLQSPAPEIIDDKLFVLDSKNRLHIFEATKNENC